MTGEISRPTLRFRELLADMCRRADFVIVTSGEQLRRVTEIVAPERTRIVLDAYDDPGDAIKRDYALTGRPRLVWEGCRTTSRRSRSSTTRCRALAPELRPEMHVVTLPTFNRFARRFGKVSTEEVARRALPGTPIVMHDSGRRGRGAHDRSV